MGLTLTGVNRYPIKSCRGRAVADAMVELWGLAGDRRWMLVDDEGVVVTARTHPKLVLVSPDFDVDGLLVQAPAVDSLRVRTPDCAVLTGVRVFSSELLAAPASDDAHAWFSDVVGESVRLVYLHDPTQRRPNPAYSREPDRVSFADGYPMLLATEESLAALNDLIAGGPRPEEGPASMTRFRPNLVVAGAPAWDEDGWRVLRIGAASFRAVKACDRCVLTTIDPDTAIKGKEPLTTLARHRRWDGKTWFAINLIPDSPGAILHVGDGVEVVEQVETSEPLRGCADDSTDDPASRGRMQS
ncbi:MAG: MOSC N-terminal beta barrel domain-containing protein [Pseudonocardiaceae bacterium]|nr:MOSC N-terminal beta barrel domain-containing protein [Pseudonocardiaceae bacterium]